MKKLFRLTNRRKARSRNPYARINWEKAATLFQKPVIQNDSNQTFPSSRTLLHLLAAAGTVGMAFLFPGTLPALGSFVLGKRSYSRWSTKQAINRLAKQKYVTIKEHDDCRVTVKITNNGLVRALTYQLNSLKLKTPKHWDGKWRVVIFDVPDQYKRIRDIFRMRLRQLGLYQLQESVYVSPYRCFNEVEFLRELYGISFTVRYLLVEKIEDDEAIRQHFALL